MTRCRLLHVNRPKIESSGTYKFSYVSFWLYSILNLSKLLAFVSFWCNRYVAAIFNCHKEAFCVAITGEAQSGFCFRFMASKCPEIGITEHIFPNLHDCKFLCYSDSVTTKQSFFLKHSQLMSLVTHATLNSHVFFLIHLQRYSKLRNPSCWIYCEEPQLLIEKSFLIFLALLCNNGRISSVVVFIATSCLMFEYSSSCGLLNQSKS